MQMSSACILLANHEPSMGELLYRVLETDGYQVLEATTEEQMLSIYHNLHPNLVLLDGDHPSMNSIRCCQKLRQLADRWQVPILVFTAKQNNKSVEQLFAAGASDCVTRPINLFLLRQKVRQLLESSRLIVGLRSQIEQEQWCNRIIHQMRRSLDRDAILTTVVKEGQQWLQVDRALVYRFQPDWSGIVIAESVSAPHLTLQGQQIPDPCLGNYWHALYLTGRVSMVEDTNLNALDPCYARLLISYQVQANLVIPIVVGDALWGLLIMQQCFAPRHWQHWEVNLLRQVATELAIAIQQAELYQAAQNELRELQQLQRLKDDLLNTASHELRGPLANIRLAAQMLEQTLAEDSRDPLHHPRFQAKIASYLQVLKQECDSEITLINDLLDLQRLESGQQVFEPGTIDLQTWLPEIVEPFVQRAQERQQQLSIDLPPELPALISDTTCLKRILVELLNNACKYTPNGETIAIVVSRMEQSEGLKGRDGGFRRKDESNCLTTCPARTAEMDCLPVSALRLSVSNTGVEIPAAETSRIFDHFYRVPGGDRWNQGGSGLGLALVKNLVTCLGGTIRVESGAGATHFIVELPVQPSADSSSSS